MSTSQIAGTYPWVCFHCGEAFKEDYLVRDELWAQAVPDRRAAVAEAHAKGQDPTYKNVLLHVRCLAERIGHPVLRRASGVHFSEPSPVGET